MKRLVGLLLLKNSHLKKNEKSKIWIFQKVLIIPVILYSLKNIVRNPR